MGLEMKELLNRIPQTGVVHWIGLRPARREELNAVDRATVSTQTGLQGDHYSGKPGGKRQVTLIQAEHLSVVASILQTEVIDPAVVRRNLVVSGINLVSLKDKFFRVGDVLLKGTGNCHPCSRMEENLGPGGYNAMRGHGGITAQVIEGGEFATGDPVRLELRDEPQ